MRKNNYIQKLGETFNKKQKHNVLIIIVRDFNAKIGTMRNQKNRWEAKNHE